MSYTETDTETDADTLASYRGALAPKKRNTIQLKEKRGKNQNYLGGKGDLSYLNMKIIFFSSSELVIINIQPHQDLKYFHNGFSFCCVL